MKIQLLIASMDSDYVAHLARVLSARYEDQFEVHTCSSMENIRKATDNRRFDVALVAPELISSVPLQTIRLPLLLWDEMNHDIAAGEFKKILKYQRISSIMGEILAQYADIADGELYGQTNAAVTAVWSPAGGCGKTTVALAYAAQKVAEGKKTVYLDLEAFSSTQEYFAADGKSISTILGKLGNNTELLLQSIRKQDNGSGIFYFCQPDNFDDMNILTAEDVEELILGCTKDTDNVVVDLSSTYNEKTRKILEMANTVLAVVDSSPTGAEKWKQFQSQNDMYEIICAKTVLVGNRGAKVKANREKAVVTLPVVQSENPVVVYKTLSAGYFHE
jgi:cellulose biosynthesis protein BcsQ